MILDAESRFRENLNFAFLSDRLMAEAMMFVEGGVATPSTLFATNSLIQAVVLHDSVIAGLVEMTGAIHPVASETLRSKLGEGIAPKVNLPELSGVSNDLTFNVWHWLCPEFVIATHSSDGDVKSLSALTDVLAV